MHFFELPAFGMYQKKIGDVEDRFDRSTVKLEPRLESKVAEYVKSRTLKDGEKKRKEEGKSSDVYNYEKIKVIS